MVTASPDASPGDLLSSAEHAVRLAAGDPATARALAHAVLNAPALPGRAEAGAAPVSGGAGVRAAETAAVAYRALALAARELGDLPLAEEQLRRSVEIASAGGLARRAAQARLSLVPLRTELGHPRQALDIAAEAEPYLTPLESAMLGVNRAGALIRLGRHGEALRRCDHAARVLGEAVRRHESRRDDRGDRRGGHPGGAPDPRTGRPPRPCLRRPPRGGRLPHRSTAEPGDRPRVPPGVRRRRGRPLPERGTGQGRGSEAHARAGGGQPAVPGRTPR
ncbi:hypothetical protein [Planomonospora venezuelensis]|uniref:hypothetical protein n=1 Tax=Planomonospora venezuelensis TaxID=1999 RepID=UPI0031EF3C2B